MVTSPTEVDFGGLPLGTRIAVSVQSDEGPTVSTFSDRGVQAFAFPTADDANEFMATARAVGKDDSTPSSVLDFALDRLTSSPRKPGYEEPLTFRIERAAEAQGGGLDVSGWVAVSPEERVMFRAWRPRCAEFSDLTRAWSRLSRPDIVERFPELRSRAGDQFGFQAMVKLGQPFLSSPGEKLMFGLAKEGSPEEWVELDVEEGPGRDPRESR